VCFFNENPKEFANDTNNQRRLPRVFFRDEKFLVEMLMLLAILPLYDISVVGRTGALKLYNFFSSYCRFEKTLDKW